MYQGYGKPFVGKLCVPTGRNFDAGQTKAVSVQPSKPPSIIHSEAGMYKQAACKAGRRCQSIADFGNVHSFADCSFYGTARTPEP